MERNWPNYYLCAVNRANVDPLVGTHVVENIPTKDVGYCHDGTLRVCRVVVA